MTWAFNDCGNETRTTSLPAASVDTALAHAEPPSSHMQQTPLRKKPQADTRLHSGLGATGKSAEAIFKSYSAGINLAGPDALRALIEQASNPDGFATLNSSCGGCLVNDFIRTPLPPAAGNSTTEIMRWLDTDGDGKLGPEEWQLAVELLGITAAEDELGHNVRRMQLTYLASTAYTRLTDVNALQVSGAGMLGRDILYEGGPRFHGQPEPMRVVKVPEEPRMRSFWGGGGDQGKGFDLRGRFSGETINNVPLRYKGNAQGVPWTAMPPIAENLLGTLQACGGPQRTRNPLLHAMSSDPHLLEELPQATLRGEQLSSGRALGYCIAESTYRGCGPIPMFVVPFGFFIHGMMVCAPCTVCCQVPCAMASAGQAHSLTLRASTLHVRTESYTVPLRPFGMFGQVGGSMQLGRTEESFPLVELREVEVRPPQPYGLNGYSPSLVVRDVSGVVVVAVDGSPEACCACGSRDAYLHAFADALRVAISGAQQRGRPLPEPLLAGYRRYASLSWIGLDRARQGIEYLPGHDQHGAPVPTGGAMVPMGGVVAQMGEVVVGVEMSGAVGPTPPFMHRQAAQIGVPIAFGQASQAEPIAYAFGAPPPSAYPAVRLSTHPPARPTGGRANEKLDTPLLDKTAGGSSSCSNSSMAPSHYASAEPTAPLTAPLAFGAAPPAAGVPPGNEVLSVRVPVEEFASGVMQFGTDGQTMQVGIPLGLGAGDIFHVVRPVRQAHWHSSGADMAQQPCQS